MHHEYIQLQQLSISINSSTILKPTDLTMAKGECIAIIGSNGSGKTTLLRLLCGLIAPSKGSLKIAGMTYTDQLQTPLLKSLIGFAPDSPPLYQNDTIKSYLNFLASLRLIAKTQIKQSINHCLEIFDLGRVQNARIHTLSKGTQQRVNLAQALIHQPQILILDEPTNGLDAQQCANFCQHLKKLSKQGTTIIIASHQHTEIIPLCNYMLKVQNSGISKIMTPLRNQEIKQTDDQFHYLA